jgi:hypothetical protein
MRPLAGGNVAHSLTVTTTGSDPIPGNNFDTSSIFFCRDCDGDGIWDDWELTYGLDPLDPADAALDSDQDGHSNLQEFLAGTDPRSSNSVTRVTSFIISGTNVYIAFPAAEQKSYVIERTESLISSNWTGIYTLIHTAPGSYEFIDFGGAQPPSRFYRVRLLP